jgi:hypothetical protein
MYIPTWFDVPLTILSFLIVYEIYRKNFGVRTIWNRQFISMCASVGWGALTAIANRNETVLSVPFFIGSVLCLAFALYIWKTQPRKLPTEPALD